MNSPMNHSKTDRELSLPATRLANVPTNVLFFDGVCGLCNRSVDFILSCDRRGAIRFAPLQGETAERVLSGEWRAANSETQTFDTIVWLDSSGREFVRSAATVRVLWRLGGVWWLSESHLRKFKRNFTPA